MINTNSIDFHIRSNDFFGTIATRIDLIRQDAQKRGFVESHNEVLMSIIDELVFLQESYLIREA